MSKSKATDKTAAPALAPAPAPAGTKVKISASSLLQMAGASEAQVKKMKASRVWFHVIYSVTTGDKLVDKSVEGRGIAIVLGCEFGEDQAVNDMLYSKGVNPNPDGKKLLWLGHQARAEQLEGQLLPDAKEARGILFNLPSFESGVNLIQTVISDGLKPANLPQGMHPLAWFEAKYHQNPQVRNQDPHFTVVNTKEATLNFHPTGTQFSILCPNPDGQRRTVYRFGELFKIYEIEHLPVTLPGEVTSALMWVTVGTLEQTKTKLDKIGVQYNVGEL